jgi:diguanylate cyclase (GGDEF)-like protein
MSPLKKTDKKPVRVLVADDEESLRTIIAQVLIDDGHAVTTAANGEEALAIFQKEPFPLVISDIIMGGMSGLELLQGVKRVQPDTQVIIMTSHASLNTALEAIRSGAYDYLVKPFDDIALISSVAGRAIERIRLVEENRLLTEKLKLQNEKLERMNTTLKELVIRDGLTGLYNHRHFQETLAREILRSGRTGRGFSLLFIDIDFFKTYNDTHGHTEGDKLLVTLSNLFNESLRKVDHAARYGGEEFVILLPETAKDQAVHVGEEIRRKISEYPFPGRESQPAGAVTLSVGVATFPEDGDNGSSLLQRADSALYLAKNNGRNRVCVPPH